MAICLECGALVHEDDRKTHICLKEDKPQKGKLIKFKKEVI
jgi:hypothetical protein